MAERVFCTRKRWRDTERETETERQREKAFREIAEEGSSNQV